MSEQYPAPDDRPLTPAELEIFDELSQEFESGEAAIIEAFDVLDEMDDEGYQAVVELLRMAVFDHDAAIAARVRATGRAATILLAHPLQADPARMTALKHILAETLDDEEGYVVNGPWVWEVRGDNGIPTTAIQFTKEPITVSVLGLTLISDFEIQYDENAAPVAVPSDSLQPALVLYDELTGEERMVPFRHVEQLDFLEGELPEPRGGDIPFMTEGEQIREFWSRVQSGRTQVPPIALPNVYSDPEYRK